MDNLRCEYEEVIAKRKKILEEIEELKKTDILNRYFKLCKDNSNLSILENDLYSQIKTDDYTYCNHIWVKVLKDYDEYEGRTYIYRGCMK